METILNLGLNDETVQGLIRASKNPRFGYDSYRRFVQMYGDVVFDLGKEPFEEVLREAKARRFFDERTRELTDDELRSSGIGFGVIGCGDAENIAGEFD